jgi:hypothetical protein
MKTKKEAIDALVRRFENIPDAEIFHNVRYEMPVDSDIHSVTVDMEIRSSDCRELYAIMDISKCSDPRNESWKTAYALSLVKEQLEEKGEKRPIYIWLDFINARSRDLDPRLHLYANFENERARRKPPAAMVTR